jgi:hypothetical protein
VLAQIASDDALRIAGSSHLSNPEFSIREWESSQHGRLRLSRFVPRESTADRRPHDCFRLDATTRLRAVRRLARLAVQTKPLARFRPPRIASLGGVGDPSSARIAFALSGRSTCAIVLNPSTPRLTGSASHFSAMHSASASPGAA